MGARDERARREVAVRQTTAAQLDELVAETRVGDEHRQCDQVGEAAAATLESLVDQAEESAYLRLETPGDVLALLVLGRGLVGEPHGLAALGDHGGRERA